MASNTRVEWMLRYDDGRTQEVTLTGDIAFDTSAFLQKLAQAEHATLLRRTITTTDWALISVEAQAWAETASVSADRRFIVAVKALRAETGWMLLETMTALDTYLASVGLSRTGVPDADSLD